MVLDDMNNDIGDTALTVLMEEEVNRRVLEVISKVLLRGDDLLARHSARPEDAHYAAMDAISVGLITNHHFADAVRGIVEEAVYRVQPSGYTTYNSAESAGEI